MTATSDDHAQDHIGTIGPARPGPALSRLAARQTGRGALVVLVVAAEMSALVAVQYRSTFAGVLDGRSIQALAADPAIRTPFGPPVALDDPGAFTVWRTGTPLAVLVAAWALLAATWLTRGEEEAGRWDLLLAGRTRIADLLARSLALLAAAVLLIGLALFVALVAALGACAAQVLPTRAAATGLSFAVLAATLLARMVADGVDDLDRVRWLTPFGVLAETRPYADDRPAPLLVLAAAAFVLAAAAMLAAHRRDAGAGLLTARDHRRAHSGGRWTGRPFAVGVADGPRAAYDRGRARREGWSAPTECCAEGPGDAHSVRPHSRRPQRLCSPVVL